MATILRFSTSNTIIIYKTVNIAGSGKYYYCSLRNDNNDFSSQCIVKHIIDEDEYLKNEAPLARHITHNCPHRNLKLLPDFYFTNPTIVEGEIDTSGTFFLYKINYDKCVADVYQGYKKHRGDDCCDKITQFTDCAHHLNVNGISFGTFKLPSCYIQPDGTIIIISLQKGTLITHPSEKNHHKNLALSIKQRQMFANDALIIGYISGYILTGIKPTVTRSRSLMNGHWRPVTNVNFYTIKHFQYRYRRIVERLLEPMFSKRMTIDTALRTMNTSWKNVSNKNLTLSKKYTKPIPFNLPESEQEIHTPMDESDDQFVPEF